MTPPSPTPPQAFLPLYYQIKASMQGKKLLPIQLFIRTSERVLHINK